MPNFHGNLRFAGDANHFVERLQNGGALVAHVRGIDSAKTRGFGSKGNQFLSFGVRRGRIFERSGDANGAIKHGLANKLFHLVELRGRRLNVVITEDHAADRGGASIIGHVDADALLFQAHEILAERLPVRLNAKQTELFLARTANCIVHRRDGLAFARNFRGDPLINF